MKNKIAASAVCWLLILGMLTARLYILARPESKYAGVQVSARTVEIASSRGFIYDRNLLPLTYRKKVYKTCIRPSPAAFIKIQNIISDEDVLTTLKKGSLAVYSSDTQLNLKNDEDILNLALFERYNGDSLCHLTGFISGSGKGIGGIEEAFDEYLKSADGKIEAVYHTDALGRLLLKEPIEIRDTNYLSKKGVVLTVDDRIQSITENVMKNSSIDRGAAVVLSAEKSEILACVSLPIFNRKNIRENITDKNSPFINRAITAFSVGSVFKAVTAAAALENGVKITDFNCSGKITESGMVFNCSKKDGHGRLNLTGALAFSCNPYFIELAVKTGAKNIIKTAEMLGFGKNTVLYGSLTGDAGNLPSVSSVDSDAAAGNLGFGQGELLATPLQIAACYAAIANGGIYNEPLLIKGFVDENGNFSEYKKSSETGKRVLSAETCAELDKGLFECIKNGTGKNAYSPFVEICGKTATAQTGRYNPDNSEILITWFCGYFPKENPQYVICIMKENGASGSSDDAPVFKEIAQNIWFEDNFNHS